MPKPSEAFSPQQTAAVVRRVRKAPAFDERTIMDIETKFSDPEVGVIRRSALAFLAKSGAEIIDKCAQDRDFAVAAANVAQCAAAYSANLKKLTALLDDVTVRAMVAVCKREDGSEVWQEAQTISEAAHAEA